MLGQAPPTKIVIEETKEKMRLPLEQIPTDQTVYPNQEIDGPSGNLMTTDPIEKNSILQTSLEALSLDAQLISKINGVNGVRQQPTLPIQAVDLGNGSFSQIPPMLSQKMAGFQGFCGVNTNRVQRLIGDSKQTDKQNININIDNYDHKIDRKLDGAQIYQNRSISSSQLVNGNDVLNDRLNDSRQIERHCPQQFERRNLDDATTDQKEPTDLTQTQQRDINNGGVQPSLIQQDKPGFTQYIPKNPQPGFQKIHQQIINNNATQEHKQRMYVAAQEGNGQASQDQRMISPALNILYVMNQGQQHQVGGQQLQNSIGVISAPGPRVQHIQPGSINQGDQNYNPVQNQQFNQNQLEQENNYNIPSNQEYKLNLDPLQSNQRVGQNVTRFDQAIQNKLEHSLASQNDFGARQTFSIRPLAENIQRNQAASPDIGDQNMSNGLYIVKSHGSNGLLSKSQEAIVQLNQQVIEQASVDANQRNLGVIENGSLSQVEPGPNEKQKSHLKAVGCLDSKCDEGQKTDQLRQLESQNHPEAAPLNTAPVLLINKNAQNLSINPDSNVTGNSSIQQQTQQQKSNQKLTQTQKIMEFKSTETTHKEGQSSNVPQQKDDEFCHPGDIKHPKKQLAQAYDALAQQLAAQPDRKHQTSRSHHHPQYRPHDGLEKSFYMEDYCPQINTVHQKGQNLLFDGAGKEQQFIAASRQHPIQGGGQSVHLNQDALQNSHLPGHAANMGEHLNNQLSHDASALSLATSLQGRTTQLTQAAPPGAELHGLPQLRNLNDSFRLQRLQHYVGMKNLQKMQSGITGQQAKNTSKDSRQSNKSKVSKQSDRSSRSKHRFQSQRKQFKSNGSQSHDEQKVEHHLGNQGIKISDAVIQNYLQRTLGFDPHTAKSAEANQILQQLLAQKVNPGNIQPQPEIKAEVEPQPAMKDPQPQEQQMNPLRMDSGQQHEAQRNLPLMKSTAAPPPQKMPISDLSNLIPKCDLNSMNLEQLTTDVAVQPQSKQSLKSLIASQIKRKAEELNQFQNAYTMLLSDSSLSQDGQAKQNQFNQVKGRFGENTSNNQLQQTMLHQISNNQQQNNQIYQFNNQKPITNALSPQFNNFGPKPQQVMMQPQQYREPATQLPAGAPSSQPSHQNSCQITEKELKLIEYLMNDDSQLLNNPTIVENLPQKIQVHLVNKLQEKLLASQQQQLNNIQPHRQRGQEVHQAQQNQQVVSGHNGKSSSSQNENGSNDNNGHSGSGDTKGVNGFTSTESNVIDKAKLQTYIQDYSQLHEEEAARQRRLAAAGGQGGPLAQNNSMMNQLSTKQSTAQLALTQQILNANQPMRFDGPTSSSAQASGGSGDDVNSKSGGSRVQSTDPPSSHCIGPNIFSGAAEGEMVQGLMRVLKQQGIESQINILGQLQTIFQQELEPNQKLTAANAPASGAVSVPQADVKEKAQEIQIPPLAPQDCKPTALPQQEEQASNAMLGKRQDMEKQNDNTISYSDGQCGQQANNTVSIPLIERVAATDNAKTNQRQQPNPVFKVENMSSTLEKNKHTNDRLMKNITQQQKEYNPYELEDNDTPMQIRLRSQIRQNQSIDQFREVKRELVNAINMNEFDQVRMIIEAKPKRSHQNMGGDRFRGSKYRGVSKNKNKWQMMIMINQKKVYVGAIQSEIDAAKFYDHIAIISQGLSAKTNFSCNVHQLKQIIKDYDIDDEYNNTGSRASGLSPSYGKYTAIANPMSQTNQNYIQTMQDSQVRDGLGKKAMPLGDMDASKSSDDDRMIMQLDEYKHQDRQPAQHDSKSTAQLDNSALQLLQFNSQALNNLNPQQIQKIHQLTSLIDINKLLVKGGNDESLRNVQMLLSGRGSGVNTSTEACSLLAGSASLKEAQGNPQQNLLQSLVQGNSSHQSSSQILPTNMSQQKLQQMQQQAQCQDLLQNQPPPPQQTNQMGAMNQQWQLNIANQTHQGVPQQSQNAPKPAIQLQQTTGRPINNYSIQSAPDQNAQLLRVLKQSQQRINGFTNDHWQNLVRHASAKNESIQQPEHQAPPLNNFQQLNTQQSYAAQYGPSGLNQQQQQQQAIIQIPLTKVDNNGTQQQLAQQQIQQNYMLPASGKPSPGQYQSKRLEKMMYKQEQQLNGQGLARMDQFREDPRQHKMQKINHKHL